MKEYFAPELLIKDIDFDDILVVSTDDGYVDFDQFDEEF